MKTHPTTPLNFWIETNEKAYSPPEQVLHPKMFMSGIEKIIKDLTPNQEE
jgi:hypothetical protein